MKKILISLIMLTSSITAFSKTLNVQEQENKAMICVSFAEQSSFEHCMIIFNKEKKIITTENDYKHLNQFSLNGSDLEFVDKAVFLELKSSTINKTLITYNEETNTYEVITVLIQSSTNYRGFWGKLAQKATEVFVDSAASSAGKTAGETKVVKEVTTTYKCPPNTKSLDDCSKEVTIKEYHYQ